MPLVLAVRAAIARKIFCRPIRAVEISLRWYVFTNASTIFSVLIGGEIRAKKNHF